MKNQHNDISIPVENQIDFEIFGGNEKAERGYKPNANVEINPKMHERLRKIGSRVIFATEAA